MNKPTRLGAPSQLLQEILGIILRTDPEHPEHNDSIGDAFQTLCELQPRIEDQLMRDLDINSVDALRAREGFPLPIVLRGADAMEDWERPGPDVPKLLIVCRTDIVDGAIVCIPKDTELEGQFVDDEGFWVEHENRVFLLAPDEVRVYTPDDLAEAGYRIEYGDDATPEHRYTYWWTWSRGSGIANASGDSTDPMWAIEDARRDLAEQAGTGGNVAALNAAAFEAARTFGNALGAFLGDNKKA